MTYTSIIHNHPRSLRISKPTNTITFLVCGQGVFLFQHTNVSEPCMFVLVDKDNAVQASVDFATDGIRIQRGEEPLVDPTNTKGLVDISGASYWFSVDSHNRRFQAGIGEARTETCVYRYTFQDTKENKDWLESLACIRLYSTTTRPLRVLRDPITRAVPLSVFPTDKLTMADIAAGTHMPVANLSTVNQKLHACISGKAFVLDDADFREFSKAIEYSIATPGCWCYETLKAKSTEFGPIPNTKETYLRITLNENNGESPGIPYVMEIWPAGNYSPIHNHGGANAVIRVLHGRIHVTLFSFLGGDTFGSADFGKGDVTWISPVLNQVHQLQNTGKQTCVTIQCYMYDAEDSTHHDYFDYLDAAGKVQYFEPNSDMDFVKFKETIRAEWNTRTRGVFQRIRQCLKRLLG
jgi:hypothetical protein